MNQKMDDHLICMSLSNEAEKLSGTCSAASTSAFFQKKKLSLQTCWSSISIEGPPLKLAYKKERILFMKYLEANSKGKDTLQILSKMKTCYEQNPSETREEKIKQLGLENERIIKSGSSFDPVLLYFASIWLISSGYRTEQNKDHVMKIVRLQVPLQKIHTAVAFYENMGLNFVPSQKRIGLILETCRNGWQFFSFQIIAEINKQQNVRSSF